MSFHQSVFNGDEEYNICCTGDVCCGDHVAFERATFTGSYRRATFTGFELIKGEVVADNYGAEKQQHTFTLQLSDGKKIQIKGRNLYKNGVWRKQWDNESERTEVLHEKHCRGDQARLARDRRMIGNYFTK